MHSQMFIALNVKSSLTENRPHKLYCICGLFILLYTFVVYLNKLSVSRSKSNMFGVNCGGSVRKRLWPNLWYWSGNLLQLLRKLMKYLSQDYQRAIQV